MANGVNPDNTTPAGSAAQQSTPRNVKEARDLTDLVARDGLVGGPLPDNIANWRAAAQTARSVKLEKATLKPSNKSAGRTDSAATSFVFLNKSYMTRIAPNIPNTNTDRPKKH